MTSRTMKFLNDFFRDLTFAASSLALYSEEHRRTKDRAAKALILLNEALVEEESLTAMFLGSDMFIDGVPLERTPFVDRMIRVAKDYGIGHIVFEHGATNEDIVLLLKIVTHQAPRDFVPTPCIRYGTLHLQDPGNLGGEFASYTAIPRELMAKLKGVGAGGGGGDGDPVDVDALMTMVGGFIAAFRQEANPFLALVPIRLLDEHSFTHAINVCILNLAQGMALGFEGGSLHDLGIAGLLHDVGRQKLPPELAAKRSGYTAEERELVRLHPVRGAEYLLNTPGIPRLAAITAFEAHLKYDRSGYPPVPADWETSLCSQITTVSLCFDVLRSKNIYRTADDFPRTAGLMLGLSGTALNRALALNFLRLLWEKGSPLAESITEPGVKT